jgi:hypothetical protein
MTPSGDSSGNGGVAVNGKERGRVYVGVPCYDGTVCVEGTVALTQASIRPPYVRYMGMSLLTKVFNTLWCEALDMRELGVTHFLMMHSDIGVEGRGWLDKMLETMEKTGADVLSAVVPIKSGEGVTSTAYEVDGGEFPGWQLRRYTMTEIHGMKGKTFTHPRILVNTGIMLVDFRKPWVEEMHFHFEDDIRKDRKGQRRVLNWPEDWLFSREARAKGAKLWATREVLVVHYGRQGFPSEMAWGLLEHDRGFEKAPLEVEFPEEKACETPQPVLPLVQ